MAFSLSMGSQAIVRSWLAFKLTGSELALGMVMFVVAIPMFLIAPIGGVVADRIDRRTLIIIGESLVLLNEIVLVILIFTDQLAFWHILVVAGFMGCVFPFIMPAGNALIVNTVGKSGLANAMALQMAGMNTTRILGPAAAGFLIDGIGVGNTYLIGVVLYGAGVFCMLFLKKSLPPAESRRESMMANIVEGFKYVREDRLLLMLLLFGLIPMFLAMPFQNLLVVFADKIWDVGSRGLGLLSTAAGVGGVVGSIWVAGYGGGDRRLRLMMVSVLGFGVGLFFFAFSPYFLLGLGLIFIADVFAAIFSTVNGTAIQLMIPDRIRGRISSLLMMSFSLPLLGTLPMSGLAEIFGAPLAVGGAAVLSVLIAVLFYMGSPTFRRTDAGIVKAMLVD